MELVAGKLTWQRSHWPIRAAYSEQLYVVRGTLGAYTSSYEVRELGNVMLQLALRHGCSRWLVHLRHVENINAPLLRRGLVEGIMRAAIQLYPAGPLRVAVVAPPIPLTEWQASLPADLSWWAFEWQEVTNEPAAGAWLTQA